MPDRYGIPSEGDQVVFLDKNGFDADLERARKFFVKGQVLTVADSDVGGWSSYLEFEECEGVLFNSVMFELKEEQE